MPTLPEALVLAEQALERGDRDRARFIYEQILQAAPEQGHALNGLGVLAFRSGELEAAESYHRRAIAAFPHDPAFYNNLNFVYSRQGRTDEAVACCRKAVELDVNSPELHVNLGTALKAAGLLDEAAASFQQALALRPDYADAHYNLANTWSQLRRLDAAESEFRRANELAPRDWEAPNNLGSLVQVQGRFSEAMALFERALTCAPDAAEAHRNRALLRLLLGDFAAGWADYEWRWQMPQFRRPALAQPCWEGQPLPGRTILVWGEQGLGDMIQFVRFAPLVAERSGARVLVQCRPALHALLRTAPGIDRLVGDDLSQETFDYYVPLLSVPAILGTTIETIPAGVPYLFAEPKRVARWRQELAGGDAFRVGIAWQGNPAFTGDYFRSVPLEQFTPLARCPSVKLFSLQKGHGREQLAELTERMNIIDLGATLDENGDAFVDTAAVMMNLDLVITSDTAIAHLAGALGVPVWVALQLAPNWRWLLDRADSPWYPTMRLFRQTRFGNWADVFSRIGAELQTLSSRPRVS